MTNTVLWRVDEDRLDRAVVEAIFQNEEGFSGVRLDEPGGALIEAKYSGQEKGEQVIVRLNKDSDAISITDAGKTSFQAALLVQQHMEAPLRIVDTDYTFDLNLSEFSTLDELTKAIEIARRGSLGSSAD